MNEPTLEPLREENPQRHKCDKEIPTGTNVTNKSKLGFTGLLKGSDSAVSLVTTQRRGGEKSKTLNPASPEAWILTSSPARTLFRVYAFIVSLS